MAAAHPNPPDIEPNVGQEPVETLIPAPGRREGPSRAAKRGVAEKAMLKLRREALEDRLRIPMTDGVEEAPHAAADKGVIHATLKVQSLNFLTG
jgi:hypothetical protein